MDARLNRIIVWNLNAFGIVATVTLLLHTTNFSAGLCLLACGYILLVLLRDHRWKLDLSSRRGTAMLYVQILIATAIFIWSESYMAQIHLLILIGEFSLYHKRIHAFFYTTFTYIGVMAAIWTYRLFPPMADIYLLLPRFIDYYALFGVGALARIAFEQRNRLAWDNEQLRVAATELEQQAKLHERTRISREIHDSVGHSLTAALTGLQSAWQAIRKERLPIAQEMIERSRDSIMKGLNDVRSSVRLLHPGGSGDSFRGELIDLLRETQLNTGAVSVWSIDETLPELPPTLESAIYRALQEGLTNGIRHGGSTQFRFVLKLEPGTIRFRLANNGQTAGTIVPGFGLRAMKERVEEAGGQLKAGAGQDGTGFEIEITLPLAEHPHGQRREQPSKP